MRFQPILTFVIAAILLFTETALAAVPTSMNVQGRLTDSTGSPLTAGVKTFTFKIYDMEVGGTEILPNTVGEDQSITTDAAGLWNANVGAVIPLTDPVFADTVRWLEITVDDGINPPVTLPRVRLQTGPYTYRVATADGASGGTITSKVSIGPGHANSGDDAFVAGIGNTVSGLNSAVGGGADNDASANHSAIGGGLRNTASDKGATVGGGQNSTASGERGNTATGLDATVGGGQFNTANRIHSTVPGGRSNVAGGDKSFAAGFLAKANYDGAFVWGDNTPAEFASTGSNQFIIHASGRVGIGTNSPADPLEVQTTSSNTITRFLTTGDFSYVNFGHTGTGMGARTWELHTGVGNGTGKFSIIDQSAFVNRLVIDTDSDVGIGTDSPKYKLDVRVMIGNNTIMYHADRRWKTDIRPLFQSLNKIQLLRGVSYEWKRDEYAEMNFPEGRHIGVIAQDVEMVIPEVVNVAEDGYKSVEYAKLVAILIEAVKEQQAQIDRLSYGKDRLTERVAQLEKEL